MHQAEGRNAPRSIPGARREDAQIVMPDRAPPGAHGSFDLGGTSAAGAARSCFGIGADKPVATVLFKRRIAPEKDSCYYYSESKTKSQRDFKMEPGSWSNAHAPTTTMRISGEIRIIKRMRQRIRMQPATTRSARKGAMNKPLIIHFNLSTRRYLTTEYYRASSKGSPASCLSARAVSARSAAAFRGA